MSMSAALSAAARFPVGLTDAQESAAYALYSSACAAEAEEAARDHEGDDLSEFGLGNGYYDSLRKERIRAARAARAAAFSGVVNAHPDAQVRAKVWAMVSDT